MDFNISGIEQKWLLSLARRVVKEKLYGEQTTIKPPNDLNRLQAYDGAFVSLHTSGELRGCVGYLYGLKPLWETVAIAAVEAAFKDSRFSPLQVEELERTEIEISVLSKPMHVESWKEIEIGKHGIVILKNSFKALFLPQIAIEQNWNLPQTLTQLSIKAGLSSNDWKLNARFEVFESVIFSES
tara:strand:- start:7615 stop:8166 length:552 start_codon:yes stop_codon:yes gene_type:complete